MTFGTFQFLQAQCPSIDYASRSPRPTLTAHNWDTIVDCNNTSVKLVADLFITTSVFDHYDVYPIPYDPPDTTFCSTAGGGGQIFANTDDIFAPVMQLPFEFMFFGRRYTSVAVGSNGVITFNSNMAGQNCPYAYQDAVPLPNTNFPIKNAIFGIYEDINPQGGTSGVPNQGIYEAIYDSFPCRKLCVSWNGIPQYGRNNFASTEWAKYQIVCYEGTNIIEVHVFRTHGNATTNGGNRMLGILNPTGDTAYVPEGRNNFHSDIDTPEAWRFEPKGTTIRNIQWFYGTDTSDATGIQVVNCDSVLVLNDGFGGDTAIIVSPTVPTTYSMRMRYLSATGIFYDISNTVTVGVDFSNEVHLSTDDDSLCPGQSTVINLSSAEGSVAVPTETIWSCSTPGQGYNGTLNSCTVQPHMWLAADGNHVENHFYCTTNFSNGCSGSDSIVVHHFNPKDTTEEGVICEGGSYTYLDQEYSEPGVVELPFANDAGCTYTKTLNLTVRPVDLTTMPVTDCHPYTWIDGNTYYESTNTPRFTLQNQYGCDSVVNLNFRFDESLRALIEATPAGATLDNLHITLRDVSVGSAGRTWIFPDGRTDTTYTTYYEYPAEQDSVTIGMIARSPYACRDTAWVTIPLLKEAIWFPNAFTPEEESNSVFRIEGIGITTLHVDIYDRRGSFVNSFDGIEGSWDGTDQAGRKCPQGSYVYLARYQNVINPDNVLTHKGTITLIR